jgi:flagellar hook protein FlgE
MDAFATAVSGMQAASSQLDVTADNIANMSTPGYRPREVSLESAAAGGVTSLVTEGPAPILLPGVPPAEQPSGTDLVPEMADLLAAPIAYEANMRIASASEQMTANLFDNYC